MKLANTCKAYPQLTLCSLLLLFLGIFGGLMYYTNTEGNQRERTQLYGTALAAGAARQAVTPAMQQDLVSMQAILTELQQHTWVQGASIHNVENQLLVQSGFKPNQVTQGRRYHFSAPIALHNNIYGYVEVVLDVPRHSERDYQFFLLWILAVFSCLFIIGWSIYRHWWVQLKDKMPSAGELVTAMVEKMPTIEPIPEPEPEAPKQVSVRLSLHITNMERLYQQLNSESFANILRRFEKQLQSVLNLYNGQRQMLSGDTLLIDFTGEAYFECAFRAVCCAQLMANLATASPSPRLQLAAAIHELSEPTNDKQSLLRDFVVQHNNHLKPDKGEILVSQRLIDTDLQQHLELVLDSGKFTGLKAPYAELVARQEQQLIATLEPQAR
ncbi:hypothetical protein [Cellvibrio japonicus]|uniref:Uncharacterized protein n=1 Tax=Cellvibrio japonicus (strain Ueda107) TaxID=498211 RepID=B3PCQ1_CELJU|nr:hypothetical protein [Cellvibrio japonicus]ACE86268.1 hypothetical protein CJA_2961 [Cellvibrio japonicus Ueda107]QEI13272.1 hypothetical protein FY117_14275 [Cellvibrio japonicus]QEI16846.1 hypothetical protein FY116_14280 [Cellvibrio japonicus]QEI20424.1 hypothetical protein FY115_14275 [Cellvibrio japonicus]